jgi:hypothetical protein
LLEGIKSIGDRLLQRLRLRPLKVIYYPTIDGAADLPGFRGGFLVTPCRLDQADRDRLKSLWEGGWRPEPNVWTNVP